MIDKPRASTPHWMGAMVLAATLVVGCGGATPPRFKAVPAGTQTETQLGVPGALNTAPSITSRWPFVAVVWAVTTPTDSAVYFATSTNNGATFSQPHPIEVTRTTPHGGRSLAPHVVLGWPKMGADDEPTMPDVHVQWQADAAEAPAIRAIVSTDGGHSFNNEPLGQPEAAAVASQFQRIPSQALVSRAVASPASLHQEGTYDECATLIVAWDDARDGASRVSMRRLVEDTSGAPHALQTMILSGAVSGSHPSVASLLGGVIVAWTSENGQASVITLQRVGLESVCQAPTSTRGRATDVAVR